MSEVKRYEPAVRNWGDFAGMDEVPDGDWVKYSDHLTAMEAKDREIARLTAICTAAGIPTTTEEV